MYHRCNEVSAVWKMTPLCVLTSTCLMFMSFYSCSVGASIQDPGNAAVVIDIKPGQLFGLRELFVYDNYNATTTTFLGIPYARRPVGHRRFQPPEHFEGWANLTSPYMALHKRLRCADIDFATGSVYGREDCLFLNVYVPDDLKKREYIYNLMFPVLIYLPPRAAMNTMLPDPRLLANEGRIIVVTIAYRTGVLGYLSHSKSGVPGWYLYCFM